MIVLKVCWTLRMSAVSSGPSSMTSSTTSTRATGYGRAPSSSHSTTRMRWAPWTRIRSDPSGTLSMRAIVPLTPYS